MKKGLMMLLALIVAGTIGISACQKKEAPAPPPPAPETQAPPAEQPPAEQAPAEKPANAQ